MRTNVENFRLGHTFRQNRRAKFKQAVIWGLSFFAATSIKTQSQETGFPTNSIPETSTNSVAPSEVSTNQVQQSHSPSAPAAASGTMAWPGGAASTSTTGGTMAWPGAPAASGQKNSSGGTMTWPNGTAPSASQPPPVTATKGVMVYPGMATSPYTPPPAPAPVAPAAAQSATSTNVPPPLVAPVPPPPAGTTAQVPPAPGAEQPGTASTEFMAPPPMLAAPRSTKNEVSASGDFMFGQGQVSLPLGYSLNKAEGGGVPSQQGAFTVPRNSTYYGGTLSYSYGQAWFIDASIAHGNSSGSQSIPTGFLGDIDSSFSIDDTWYQLYLKYTFPQLRGKRFSAYLRAGGSYVSATLKDTANQTSDGAYNQTDNTQDYLGNVGVGLSYSLYTTHKLRIDLQGEIEGFGGVRYQQSTETLSKSTLPTATADINNTLYGANGIATVHAEYRMGKSGLFKIFGEVGLEGRYDIVNYSDSANSAPNEYLWGPYLKLGLRYDF